MVQSLMLHFDGHWTTRPDLLDGTTFRWSGYRDYNNALTNAKACADAATARGNIAALVSIGDDNDVYSKNPEDAGTNTEDREAMNLVFLNEIWGTNGLGAFSGPKYGVIGNWTFSGISDDNNANGADAVAKYDAQLPTMGATVNNGVASRYYSFDVGIDLHCVVLDTNSDSASVDDWQIWQGGETNWNQGVSTYVSETQQAWLAADLAANRGKMVVIFSHMPMSPSAIAFEANVSGYITFGNVADVVQILHDEVDAGGDIVGCIAGHHHPGTQDFWTADFGPNPSAFQLAQIQDEADAKGIYYIHGRAPTCAGGDNPAAIDLVTIANAYAIVEVGRMVVGEPRIRVRGLGTHPGQVDFNNENYAII